MARVAGFDDEHIIFTMDDGSSKSLEKSLCDFIPEVGMELDITEENGRYTLTMKGRKEKGGFQVPHTRGDLKALAKERMKGNYLNILPLMLLMYIDVGIAFKASGFHTLLCFFLYPCIEVGMAHLFLEILERGKGSVETVGKGFKPYWRCVCLSLLETLYLVLWTCLCIVPGIVKAIAYSQTRFILAENPEIEPNDAITMSRKMMDGHKWQYCVMWLSFLGWWILSLLTCGILLFYVNPYWEECTAIFYRSLKEGSCN